MSFDQVMAMGWARTSIFFERVPAMSIRVLLVLLVAACVLPGSLMSAYLIFDANRVQRDEMVHGSVATARAMVSALDQQLAGLESGLNVLAASPLLAADDLEGFYHYARAVIGTQNASTYVLIDRTGRQRLNTLRPYGAALPGNGSPQLRHILVTGKSAITDLFVGPVTAKPIIAMGVPVRRSGEVVYVLSVGIFPERVAELLQRQRLPSTWIGAVLDGKGTLIARTHDMDRFVGKMAVPDLVKAAAARPEGTLEIVTLEGIPVVTAFSRSEISGWTVALGIPTSELTEGLRKSVLILIAATVALLAAGLLVAWRLGGRITGAIHGLVDPALELGSGMVVTVRPLHLKEADEVGRALVAASNLLSKARYGANFDGLTGLANRVLFGELLKQQLAICRRDGSELSVLFIDLDGFKGINDVHGHARGDDLLRAAASRIKGVLRGSDLPARHGGDEFVVLLTQSGIASAEVVAAKMVASLSAPYQLEGLEVRITASVGIATFPGKADSGEALLVCADAAMYAAKKSGKNRYAVA